MKKTSIKLLSSLILIMFSFNVVQALNPQKNLSTIAFASSNNWSFEEEKEFVISSSKDKPVFFTTDFIETSISIQSGKLKGLTITSLPKPAEGLLILDYKPIELYQQIGRTEISKICFIPVYGSDKASFTFIPETSTAMKTKVVINMLDNNNPPPLVSNSNYFTMKNMGFTGYAKAMNSNKTELSIKMINAPTLGTVKFTGTAFTYTPYTGKTGTDSFSFCAVDDNNNISKEAFINITIEDNKTGIIFSDMSNNAYQYSAIKANQAGLISGEKIGNIQLFYPEAKLTKGDFLIMLIAATGYEKDIETCINTGLVNDSNFRLWTKPYIDVGIKKGIIEDNHFDYDANITRAEAVYMVDKALGLEDIEKDTVYIKDISGIPSYAVQSFLNLSSYGLLNLYDGNAYPNAYLTRDFAADLIYNLYNKK